jgi:hypothetical protein
MRQLASTLVDPYTAIAGISSFLNLLRFQLCLAFHSHFLFDDDLMCQVQPGLCMVLCMVEQTRFLLSHEIHSTF